MAKDETPPIAATNTATPERSCELPTGLAATLMALLPKLRDFRASVVNRLARRTIPLFY